ncbi:ATP-binding cassette domain-containing protein [Pleurocapsales cyanobacterium LEGE 10410]|nr:ATP-binding cassette domain-containing protein [Pleurocapsales cyanobacterium LEGE 10410]
MQPNTVVVFNKIAQPKTVVAIEGLDYHHGKKNLRKQILFDINVEIRAGEIVFLTGPSGSGKTTLLTLIGGLRSPQSGSLRVLGEELNGASSRQLRHLRRNIGYIFQGHNLLDSLTARQNVQMGLGLHSDIPRRKGIARAEELLIKVGLGDWIDTRPNKLSVGQQQRVAIARALASYPKIVLADEPTASLDKKSGLEVIRLMQNLAKEQSCTVVLVTHDVRIFDFADRRLNLEDGRLA